MAPVHGKIDPFAINVETVTHVANHAQYGIHIQTPNKPCNCTKCVIRVLNFGAVYVERRAHPSTGDVVWVPKTITIDGSTMLDAISAKAMRDLFTGSCRGDTDLFVSKMIHDRVRALTHTYPSDYLINFDGVPKKRKAKGDDAAGPAKRPANSSMAASQLMPSSTTTTPEKSNGKERATHHDIDLSGDDDDEEERVGDEDRDDDGHDSDDDLVMDSVRK